MHDSDNYELPSNNYIAGIQQKNVSKEWQDFSEQISKLHEIEVELFKLNNGNKSWENYTVPYHAYESEDARGKGKKSLKRKADKPGDTTVLKRSSQQPDTIADKGEEIRLEYCNAPSPITVSSRQHQLTLVPKCPLGKSFVGKDDTSNRPFTSDTNTTDISQLTYHKTLSLNPHQGGQGGGDGNDSDEEKKHKRHYTQCSHRNVNPKKNYLSEQSQIAKEDSQLNNVLHRVDHSFNYCKSVNRNATCQDTCATWSEKTAECLSKGIENFSMKSDTKPSWISQVLVMHSIRCENQTCNVPVCRDIRHTLEEDYKTSLLDDEDLHMTPWDVLLSDTELIRPDSEIKLCEKMKTIYEQKAGAGSFGDVSLSCLAINNINVLMAVKKISAKDKEGPPIDDMVKCLKDLGKHKYLLTPDLILSTKCRQVTLLMMEKGEMSLHKYLEMALTQHVSECPKVISKNDHIGKCNSGISAELCCYYFVQIASALKYIHDCGYVHGDIKSQNIMLMPGFMHVKLIDYDFIKKEEVKKQCGTPGYAAPEIFEKNGNTRKSSDVWAATLLIPHMYFGVQICAKTDKLPQFLEFMKQRNSDFSHFLGKHQPELADVFKRGTEWDFKHRPAIDKLLRCFTDNKNLRDMFNATQNPRMYAPVDRESLSKRILQNWLYGQMQPRLPLKEPKSILTESTWVMDIRKNLEEQLDLPVKAILKN